MSVPRAGQKVVGQKPIVVVGQPQTVEVVADPVDSVPIDTFQLDPTLQLVDPAFRLPDQGEWTQDAKGRVTDPVTIYVHGNLDTIKAAFVKAGWSEADPSNVVSYVKYADAASGEEEHRAEQHLDDDLRRLEREPTIQLRDPFTGEVNQMPVSSQTFKGHPILVAFEKDNDPLRGRHHFRVFETGRFDDLGRPVYAIAATHDVGIIFDKDTVLTHKIDPDSRSERELVLSALLDGGASKTDLSLPFVGDSHSGATVPDGRAYDVVFDPQP